MDSSGDALPVKPFAFGEIGNQNDELEHDPRDFIVNQPLSVRRRVQALRKMQLATVQVEAEFFKKIHELECEYHDRFQKLHNERTSIVSGEREPTDAEADYPLLPVTDDELPDELKEKLSLQQNGATDDVKGIPDFWLTVFKNNLLTVDIVQEHDEPILKHLTDVTLHLNKEPMGFRLDFHFSANEYFSNTVLTKEYMMTCDPEPEDPFDFDGPEIIACTGCKIDWKPTKNVTVKLIKKKQKHKQKSQTRFVTKEVKADSFFNFFDPPPHTKTSDPAIDDDTRLLLHADFELGQCFRDTLIPRAVLCYTGECDDGESIDDEFEGEDGEDEDEEDDDDDQE